MKRGLVGVVVAFAGVAPLLSGVNASIPKQEGDLFYVYLDSGYRKNHYIPSGYMGDWSDIKLSQAHKEKPYKGQTCIRVIYTAERKQNAGWAGVFWTHPDNNWANKKGGFDLTGYTKLKFWARGEKGGEYLDKFGFGGIQSADQDGDTDEAATDAIELTKDWKEYTIDLSGLDLSHIIGGFVWAMNADSNPQGATFYLDEIRYER